MAKAKQKKVTKPEVKVEEVIPETPGIVEGSILPSEEDFVLVDNSKDEEPPFVPDEPKVETFVPVEDITPEIPVIPPVEEEVKPKEKVEKKLNEDEILSRLAKLKETAETTNTLTTEPKKELSYQAKKWKAYLEYNKISPEDFIKRYPKHKFLEFVKEFMEFDKNSNKENI